jgi:hypothetical protein
MKLPEQYRFIVPAGYGRLGIEGNNGIFIIPHYKVNNYELRCIASTVDGWEHVSVTVSPVNKKPTRCPTWDEMCYIKDQFWEEDQEVAQFHPKKADYVNFHNYCLHLWRQIDQPMITPNGLL